MLRILRDNGSSCHQYQKSRRGLTIGLAILSHLAGMVEPVDITLYEVHEKLARR
jgi:hypothetical protein